MANDGERTRALLRRVQDGDAAAGEELYALVHRELRDLAGGLMRGRAAHTLQPTALVHEAWLRLAGGAARYAGRAHFVSAAVTAMRHILIDHARARAAEKRGGDRAREPLHADSAPAPDRFEELLALDDALAHVGARDERARRVAELRLYGGLALDEIAEVLALSPRTVDRAWCVARDLLRGELGETTG